MFLYHRRDILKVLSKSSLNKIGESIIKYGRPLEQSLFKRHFQGGTNTLVIGELRKFQNNDGGFGHGIESDFRLPYSSPIATSVGVRILSEIDGHKESKKMIKAAIEYFEMTFDRNRNGWFAVPKEVNDFPHAPWWHFKKDDGMTIIDKNWGNPSAEIIAYLYKYKDYAKGLDVNTLIEYAINYIESKEEFNSENEIYCYIKLHNVLPKNLKIRLEKVISTAIEKLIVYSEEKWLEYVPTPVDFVSSINSCRFGVLESKINENLDFLINQLQSHGKIIPPWGESYYSGDLKGAYNEWIGVWSLKALITLDRFNRIEK